ncbi:MAG: tail fiber domain-containing protein [Bacteroidia bacterium]
MNNKAFGHACPTSPPCPSIENKTLYSQMDPITSQTDWYETTTVFCSGEKITIHALFSPNISLTTSSMFYNDFNFRCDGNRLGQLTNGDYTFGLANRFNYIGDDITSSNNPLSPTYRTTGFHNFYNNINAVFGTYNHDQINSTVVNPVVYWHNNIEGGTSKLRFMHKNGSSAIEDLATLLSNGNFGINTTNPLSKLEVKGGLNVTDQTSGISAPNGFIYASGGIHLGSESFISSVAGNTFIATYPGTKAALGLNDPAAYLHLHALNTSGTNHFQITNNSTGTGVYDGVAINVQGNTTDFINFENGPIRFFTNGTQRMRIEDNGDLIVNGTSSVEKLTIYGNAAKNSGGNTWATFSDIRLKENIKSFNLGLDAVLKIKPIEFNYNGKLNTNKNNKEIGVIAQELEKDFNFMINEFYDSTFGNFLTVNNGPMVYMLINAVKELNTEINKLKNKIEKLNIVNYIDLNEKTELIDFDFVVFPNPTIDNIRVYFNSNEKFNLAELVFFNGNNNIIKTIKDLKNNKIIEINLADVKNNNVDNIYVNLIIDGLKVTTKKVIIIK